MNMEEIQKHTLGVIGGLGPIATAYFMELVTQMTEATTDQEHLDMILYSCPSIPDRTEFILNHQKPNPLPALISIGNRLAEQGAAQIAIPCMTAHYFYEELSTGIKVPVIHAIQETVSHLKKSGVTTAGIMATDGTIRAQLFQQELNRQGIKAVIPSPDGQKDVMHLIYQNIKANRPAEMERFLSVGNELRENGAETIILGCTELSLIKRENDIGHGYIDAMEVLAQQAIIRCGGQLKENYVSLIT